MGISNIICKCWDQNNICQSRQIDDFSQNPQFGNFGNTSEIKDRFGKFFSVKASDHHYMMISNSYECDMNIFGGFGVHQAPSKTPKKSPQILLFWCTERRIAAHTANEP